MFTDYQTPLFTSLAFRGLFENLKYFHFSHLLVILSLNIASLTIFYEYNKVIALTCQNFKSFKKK